ncbi:hypothetical protein E3U23_11170 [Erythrobacter litoralis]|uniref:hypothetical protein n=1 Tax=Erythrobacter litoralis TaxID=39960 RepID=UPI0024353826|nr:hypothetical protein [Erythrobacter litoralis]MDG6079749.1 hypothetical protein [Erythrobacter litoralis]
MIELPDAPAPNGASPAMLDFGIDLVPPTGAAELRVDRPGSRFTIEVSFPPMEPEKARVFVSRLLEAKRKGVRIPFPLLGVDQGIPGEPRIAGGGQAGTTIAMRGFVPGYVFKEGFWLSIENVEGQHFLHNCRSTGIAADDGRASMKIEPALRFPFADGAKVHLVEPMIEGRPVGTEWGWQIPVNRLIALSVPIREVA